MGLYALTVSVYLVILGLRGPWTLQQVSREAWKEEQGNQDALSLVSVSWALDWAHMDEDLDHMADHMDGWGWGWMTLLWLFWVVVAALLVWGVWVLARRGSARSTRTGAVAVLQESLARGDISPEEYRERREVLEAR